MIMYALIKQTNKRHDTFCNKRNNALQCSKKRKNNNEKINTEQTADIQTHTHPYTHKAYYRKQ